MGSSPGTMKTSRRFVDSSTLRCADQSSDSEAGLQLPRVAACDLFSFLVVITCYMFTHVHQCAVCAPSRGAPHDMLAVACSPGQFYKYHLLKYLRQNLSSNYLRQISTYTYLTAEDYRLILPPSLRGSPCRCEVAEPGCPGQGRYNCWFLMQLLGGRTGHQAPDCVATISRHPHWLCQN